MLQRSRTCQGRTDLLKVVPSQTRVSTPSATPGWSRHPLLQQRRKRANIQLSQEQPKCGIRWWLGHMGAQQLVDGFAVAFGKTLHAHPRTLAAQERKNGHQQHPPLREANPGHIGQSGKALRKLIRSVAAEGFSCGDVKAMMPVLRREQHRCNPMARPAGQT